jgi:hypothetical protein
MSHGFRCKHCGYQQTEHENHYLLEDNGQDPKRRKDGYRISLASCPGYQLTSADQKAEAEAEEIDPVLRGYDPMLDDEECLDGA